MRKWLAGCLTLLFLFTLFTSASAESFERVYLYKVMDDDDKALVVRSNGDMYLIEYGIGVLSIWRYEGKTVYISSPGMFAGIGSKVILPDADQEAKIWDSEFVENINQPTLFPTPPANYAPAPKPQTTVKPTYSKTEVIIAVEKASVFSKPENKAENIIGSLPFGTPLVLDSVNISGWHTIVAGKTALYVSKNHTTSFKTIAPKIISVKADKGYFFNIPSNKGKSLGSFVKNTLVAAIGENNNFWFVLYPNGDGTFTKGFISKTVAY